MIIDLDKRIHFSLIDCGSDYFQCPVSRACIHKYRLCNGQDDCSGGDDEKGCMGSGK